MNRTRVTRLGVLIVGLLAIGVIALVVRGRDSATEVADDPVGTVEEPATTSSPSTTTSTSAPTALPSEVIASGGCPELPPRAGPDEDRPRYVVDVAADPRSGSVTGELSVHFQPDIETDRLVFRLWPNSPRPAQAGALLEVGPVRSGEATLSTDQPDPTTLIVHPGRLLAPGESLALTMPFELNVPGSAKDRISRSEDSLRLGSFLPLLAWQPGLGWATDPPTSAFAESTTSPTAAWEVTVEVPDGYDVLASALPSDDGTYRVDAARDFAMSIGRFETVSATLELPHPVDVVVGVHAGVGEGADAYLERVTAALSDFSTRYGAYPYDVYTLAITPGLTGGIEFPGHVMQGPGSQGRTSPHEVAHMWFYGLVGNNQGASPWLDEGLATFAEARFEGTLTAMQTRDIPSEGRGRAGAPMTYWEAHPGAYYRSVYVQTAAALAQLGPPEAVDCALAHHASQHAHLLVEPEQIMNFFEQFFPDARAVLAPYGLPAA